MERLGRSARTPLFILGPLHISETNRARKLKFGTLVTLTSAGALYKNLSDRWRLVRPAAHNFYFGIHSICLKLIKL